MYFTSLSPVPALDETEISPDNKREDQTEIFPENNRPVLD
jgi:hypothetical protein